MKLSIRLALVAFLALMLLCANAAFAQVRYIGLPANAATYLPILVQTQRAVWPNATHPGWMGAQVQKESCITVKHSKCWNPRSELKTAREYGFGFGQITIAYHANGKERFNVFQELTNAADPKLRNWAWDDRFNPEMQLRAMIVKNKIGYERISGAADSTERLAFSLAGYNGGLGGVLSDRRMCMAVKTCDQSRWFGHTEYYSMKSRVKWQGYGKSAFEINREYPRTIMLKLTPLYAPYF